MMYSDGGEMKVVKLNCTPLSSQSRPIEIPTDWLTMCALLMLLAAFLTVSAVSNQEKSDPQSSRIRATRNGT